MVRMELPELSFYKGKKCGEEPFYGASLHPSHMLQPSVPFEMAGSGNKDYEEQGIRRRELEGWRVDRSHGSWSGSEDSTKAAMLDQAKSNLVQIPGPAVGSLMPLESVRTAFPCDLSPSTSRSVVRCL